jgi:predicted transcriptional regulator of viral defense system
VAAHPSTPTPNHPPPSSKAGRENEKCVRFLDQPSPSARGGRENEKSVRFLDQPSPGAAIVELADAQHAVFSLAQLVGLGLTPRAVQMRAASSRLHRIHHTVYSLVPRSLLTRKGHRLAAVLACGEGAVLSHQTAAALHGLRPTQRAKIDVTVPRRSARRHRGIDLHRSTTLAPEDVRIVDGIRCTTVARTLLDLAEVVSRRALERAFDQAEALEVLDLNAILGQLERNRSRRGSRRIKRVLETYYIGSAPTESQLEEAFFAICRRINAPLPEVQKWIDLRDGEPMIRADFLWREQRVIVETDGDEFHGTRQARERDPRRDQRALLAGWVPMRTTWRQVMHRPWELERTIVKLVLR